jgi:hypothetical protein
MAMTHHTDFKRLILQIERDLVSQAHLRTLLTHAETTVVDHVRELRTVEAHLKHMRHVNGIGFVTKWKRGR